MLRRTRLTAHLVRDSASGTGGRAGTPGATGRVMQDLAEAVATRSGLDESEARLAIATVEEAIAPGSLHHAQELYFRLARRLTIEPGRAVEVAQIVCHAIAARLDGDRRAELLGRLPRDLQALFAPPPSLAATGAHPPGLAGTGHTLADGHPGSDHPLSESRPPPRRPR